MKRHLLIGQQESFIKSKIMTTVPKVLIFAVVCVTLNSIIAEGSFLGCDPIKDQQNVTWDDFIGSWNVIYPAVYLSALINQIRINLTKDGGVMYMDETTNILIGTWVAEHIDLTINIGGDVLECCKGDSESHGKPQSHFKRRLTMPKEGSTLKNNLRFPTNLIGTQITFISKDAKCYLIYQVCLKPINLAEKAIAFRDKVPTKECEDAALAAYKEAGLDESSITKDKSFQ